MISLEDYRKASYEEAVRHGEAVRRLCAVLASAVPVGSTVLHRSYPHVLRSKVLGVSDFDERVCVEVGGKPVWISARAIREVCADPEQGPGAAAG